LAPILAEPMMAMFFIGQQQDETAELVLRNNMFLASA
jgi:hypothetical protein